VHRDGHWTIARRRGGYVGLWSWRPVGWRIHDLATTYTNRLREEFDLVAEGGPDNVWIAEVGDVDRWGDLATFRRALLDARIDVDDLGWAPTGDHRGFHVAYDSPAEGRLELGWDGPLHLDGEVVEVHGSPRFDNPFCRAEPGDAILRIECEGAHLSVDLGRVPARGPDA
jgi:hypothetical protein